MTKSVKISDIQKLAIPALISGIAEPILSITDTIIVGNIPENATISLGAVGIVGSFISMLIWVFGQTRSVIASIIAQAVGKNNLKEVQSLPAQGILIIISSSILIILLTYFNSEGLFRFYNGTSGKITQANHGEKRQGFEQDIDHNARLYQAGAARQLLSYTAGRHPVRERSRFIRYQSQFRSQTPRIRQAQLETPREKTAFAYTGFESRQSPIIR